jgi:hypothetical protein
MLVAGLISGLLHSDHASAILSLVRSDGDSRSILAEAGAGIRDQDTSGAQTSVNRY